MYPPFNLPGLSVGTRAHVVNYALEDVLIFELA